MQSTDDPLISPYSTASFASSYSSAGAETPTFHRYQHGDLVTPWYGVPDPVQEPDTHTQHGSLDSTSFHQGYEYQVLSPYMVTEPAMYGQSATNDPSAISLNQQTPSPFSPGSAAHKPPGLSPSSDAPGVYYQDSQATTSYIARRPSSSVSTPVAYTSHGSMDHPAGYSTGREGAGAATEALYMSSSASSLDSAASRSYPATTNQTGQTIFTFITPQVGRTPTESLSFASDTGSSSQHRSQKPPKKRSTGTGTRRPRKPPPDTVEAKPQTAPEPSRRPSTAASPKRARSTANTAPTRTFESTPDSSLITSPGGHAISKSQIGQRSRTSPDRNQTPKAKGRDDGAKMRDAEGFRQGDSTNPQFLSQKLLEFMEENHSLNRRADELRRDVQRLMDENSALSRYTTELRKDVVDMKCKMLEYVSGGDGGSRRDISPRADLGVGQSQQMSANTDPRRQSTSSNATSTTAIPSRRNSTAETVYSNEDAAWWRSTQPKGAEYGGGAVQSMHNGMYQGRP